MSYADQPTMSTRKVVSIGLVVVLHAIIGYAFITGLAFNVVKKVASDLKTFDVAEDAPPPPDKPPPPPPEKVVEPPPVVAPPPVVVVQTVSPPTIAAVPVAPPPVITPTAPPAPPVPQIAVKGTPKGNFQALMTTEDYPSASLRNNEEGTVSYRLAVGPDGKVTGCDITQSSGFPALDQTSCRLLQRRARFNPAKGTDGQPMAFSYPGRFTWRIPKD